ncbi:MAG: hypothetical protein LBK82_17665 [Planctomycetaceae bacterium]|nr:hypothetical protein [Planctomycetaceae bacterium]
MLVGLQVFSSAPLGATHNNPPQRGGLKPPINFALKGQCQFVLRCPFQGDCGGTVTHRVAVGCYALPLQGGGKLAILLSFLS